MKNITIEICFLKSFPSVSEGIFSLVPSLSKSKLKSFHFKKNFLNKKILEKDTISFPLELINHQKINPIYQGNKNSIIFEDEHLLVINKAENTHIHPLNYLDEENVLSWMITAGYGKYLDVNSMKYDRGLLYRLDFETSGLLYYVKIQEAYEYLRENFNSMVKEKSYLCVVNGKAQNEFKFQHHLKSTQTKGSFVQVCTDEAGVLANLSGSLLSYNEKEDKSLVKVNLKQGSRHQIRVQLSHEGIPIVGDTKYGGSDDERIFLHCFQYKFSYETTNYECKSELFNKLEKYFPNVLSL
jgi:23S rRNA pseudouridine1911/1915/1917 synthase